MLHPDDIQDGEICFLLEVDWLGMKYRFSTLPIDLVDSQSGQTFRYNGGLGDPSIDQQTEFVGFDIDGNSISLDLTWNDIDWMNEWRNGRSLDLAEADLSMIVIKDGFTAFKYEDRVPLFKGKVKDPIFGTPTKPAGNIIFSIENSTNLIQKKLLANSFEIDPYVFPGLDQRAAVLGKVIDVPVGQYVPFVFGELGKWFIRKSGTGRFETIDVSKPTPSYIIDTTGSGSALEITLIIGIGEVGVSRIRIYDDLGGNFVNTVSTAVNADGTRYSFTTYQVGHVIEDNSFTPGLDEDQTFWVSWGEYGEGIQDPLTGQSLGLAGNLSIYCLEQSGLSYNREAWIGLLPVLNRYKFAGYMNDPAVLVMDWWEQNIVRNLPIEVFPGDKGIEPRLNLYFTQDQIRPQHHILESGMFEVQTGLQPLPLQPINKVTVKYCYTARLQHYLGTVVIDPLHTGYQNPFIQRDPVSDLSYSRYGLRETVMELPFVWDMHTAYRIARDKIRMTALGAYGVEVFAFPSFGYLQIGEVISFTSHNLGLKAHKCQIVGKSWSGGKWRFVLHLEDNSIVNGRELA
jgi:hypothetical protein